MIGLPPVVFFKGISENWIVSSTNFATLTLMKVSESQKIDTSLICSSFQRHPDTTVDNIVQEVREQVMRTNSNFIPLLNEGEGRIIGGREFVILGGILDLPDIGTVIQTAYLHLDFSPTELNVIEIFSTMLFENALDDEPEVHEMLDRVIIANPII
jgi:hypothetical protein